MFLSSRARFAALALERDGPLLLLVVAGALLVVALDALDQSLLRELERDARAISLPRVVPVCLETALICSFTENRAPRSTISPMFSGAEGGISWGVGRCYAENEI